MSPPTSSLTARCSRPSPLIRPLRVRVAAGWRPRRTPRRPANVVVRRPLLDTRAYEGFRGMVGPQLGRSLDNPRGPCVCHGRRVRALPHAVDPDPRPSGAALNGPRRALGSGRPPPGIPPVTQRPHGRRGHWPNGSTSSTRSSSADTTQPTPYRPATRHAPTESGVAVMNPSPNDYSATPRWHVHFVML